MLHFFSQFFVLKVLFFCLILQIQIPEGQSSGFFVFPGNRQIDFRIRAIKFPYMMKKIYVLFFLTMFSVCATAQHWTVTEGAKVPGYGYKDPPSVDVEYIG